MGSVARSGNGPPAVADAISDFIDHGFAWFDDKMKKDLPPKPKRVIVTILTGLIGLFDFIELLRRCGTRFLRAPQ